MNELGVTIHKGRSNGNSVGWSFKPLGQPATWKRGLQHTNKPRRIMKQSLAGALNLFWKTIMWEYYVRSLKNRTTKPIKLGVIQLYNSLQDPGWSHLTLVVERLRRWREIHCREPSWCLPATDIPDVEAGSSSSSSSWSSWRKTKSSRLRANKL